MPCPSALSSPAWRGLCLGMRAKPRLHRSLHTALPAAAVHLEAGTLPSGFIKSPHGDIINNIIFQGAPNPHTAFKGRQYGIPDVFAFTEGTRRAVAFATEAAARGLEEEDEEQLTGECAAELRRATAQMSTEEREALHVQYEDIYLAWVAKMGRPTDSEVLVHFVTLSARGVGQVMQNHLENKDRIKAFKDHMANNLPDTKEEFSKRTNEFSDSLHEIKMVESPLVITNVLLRGRLSGEEATDWRVAALHLRDTSKVLHPFFQMKWRGRLFFALKGFRYMSILRYDYASDLAMAMLVSAIIINRFSGMG